MSTKRFFLKNPAFPEVKVIIICEDLESGQYANQLQEHLGDALKCKINFRPEAWTFRTLQHPELQELAAKEIAEADIVLFSTRGDCELPLSIRAWLDICLEPSKRPRALVALFGPCQIPSHVDM